MKIKGLQVLLLILVLAITGCSGANASAGATKLNVNMTEFMFEPTDYTIPAGQEITIKLTNDGAIMHEFVILKKGTEITVPFNEDDEDKVYWEHELEAGQSATVTFMAPTEPGEYQIICGISGHMEAGMVSNLVVVP